MSGPMPTRPGHIVITHGEATRSLYLVWRVTSDGQQHCEEMASSAWAMSPEGAMKLAGVMAGERGCAIFSHDPESGEWMQTNPRPS